MTALPPPAITVITPCLNAVSTIERALDSVRDQGGPGVEHIVVDGGSTDGTTELLARRPDVRFVSEPDDGLSDALNKGLAMASGDLIGWLNADDWYLPGAFAAVLEAAAAHPEAGWITGRCPIVDEDGSEIRQAVTRYKNFLLRHYSFATYLTQNFVSCPSTFVRRSAYRSAGSFELSQHYAMDYDMFLRLARAGDPVILDRDLAVFMMSEGTKSMSGFEQQFREHFEIARARGEGHPVPVVVNWVASHAIIAVYRLLRLVRSRLPHLGGNVGSPGTSSSSR
ncbi:MAG: glycosyltransferase family 2 protein [Acidimicrobiales bacterium]